MTVLLTVSETLGGAAIADSLAGGGSGIDLGSVTNNNYAPLTNKTANTGHQDLYISHDATIDPITDVKFFIQEYGIGTGFTYGGADTATNDDATLRSLGNNSGSSKNNADGLSGGLWIDMDWNASTANQFDQANFPALVKIFGDNVTDGTDLATAFALATDAMVYDAPGETAASAPVAGQIGKANDTVLGEAAHLKMRIYLPNAFSNGGIVQTELVIAYSFTA
jgi:hypothetical protein